MKKKWIIVCVLTFAFGLIGYYIWTREKTIKIEWRTAFAEIGDLSTTVTATGTLSAVTTVQVGTQVSGTVSKIFVDFNSQVKKGQVVAEIDKTYLSASLEDARANTEKMQILLDQAKREFNRAKQLLNEKVVSQSEYDVAYANLQSAISNLRSAQAQLNRANINLQYATITAPISGVVISRSVDIGQTVAASFNTPTLFTIANDLTKMQLQASVDEADIGQVKMDQAVTFTVDAFPDMTFHGKVIQIRLQPTVLQNVVTYIVIIDVPNPDLKLMPGMTANITINIAGKKHVLIVPKSAVKFKPPKEYFQSLKKDKDKNKSGDSAAADGSKKNLKKKRGSEAGGDHLKAGDKARIWIKKGDELRKIKVVLGFSDDSNVEVSGEIKEGDEVVIGAILEKKDQQAQNPFAPQMGPPRSGGGGRRGM